MIRQILRSEHGFSGWSLIGILITAAIIVYLSMTMIPKYTGAGEGTAAKAKSPMGQAESVSCFSNLMNIRTALQTQGALGGGRGKPANLNALVQSGTGLTADMLYCPTGGKQYPYGYDPATGKVWCTYPGHEKN